MTFGKECILLRSSGLIITIQHLFTRKVTIQYPEQVREMSPVYRGQHMKRMNKVERIVRLWFVCVVTTCMKAEERKADENICTERKNMRRYMKSICCVVFCGLCEEACPKDAIYLTTSKVLVPSSYEREDFIFGKDKLCL
jgi:NADH-quinone oxidoreductase subunit I